MLEIKKKGKKISIKLEKYDPEIISCIKEVAGRKYNPKYRTWEIPSFGAKQLIEQFTAKGIQMSLDGEVTMEVEAQAKLEREIDTIRSNPESYKGSLPLYDFQKIGASFMRAMPACLLADVPGLGKTLQSLASLENNAGPHLILCPASLKYSWEEEIKKWTDNPSLVVDGDKETREKLWKNHFINNPQKYTIANYELLLRDLDLIKKIPWASIVCDEATRISNPTAKTTKALKSLSSKKRIALTGTPISNSPTDIWSIADWLFPGYLGDFYSFQDRYCVFDDWADPTWRKVSGYKNLDELSEKVGRIMLRRTKEEVLEDFPKKTHEQIVFDLTSSEKEAYKAVKLQIFDELQKLEVEGHNLHVMPVKMLRLKQLTDDSSLITSHVEGESSKMKVLKELLEPVVASGDKAIIFTQFAEMAKLMEAYLQDYAPMLIYGGVDNVDRFEMIQRFNKEDKNKVLIMTEAGAYGLNIQRASYVFHYDAPWSIAKLQQREDRSHRIGQTKLVTVYSLIAKNTIDQYVAKVLHRKQEVSVNILSDMDRLKEAGLNLEDIKSILRL